MSPRARNLLVGWLLALVAMVAFCDAGPLAAGPHAREGSDAGRGRQGAGPGASRSRCCWPPIPAAPRPTTGRWARDASPTPRVLLDNQQREGRTGVRMYCVLFPDEGVQPVLVDAGWWPLDGRRDVAGVRLPAGATQSVRGLLAPPPSTGIAHGDALAPHGDDALAGRRGSTCRRSRARWSCPPAWPRACCGWTRSAGDDAGVMLAPGERDLDDPGQHAAPRSAISATRCSGSAWRSRCSWSPWCSP